MVMKINVQEHLKRLGRPVRDKVTGFKGVLASVGFDLYGCIQCIVTPSAGQDGKPGEGQWFDISRLEDMSEEPVMAPPDFNVGKVAAGEHGPAERPAGYRG